MSDKLKFEVISVLIVSNNKIIDFNITGYQFPNHRPSSDDFDYDANWLICEITYLEDSLREVYEDACLLTCELDEIIEGLSKVVDGEEGGYISEFLEPYLRISITNINDNIIITIHFVYEVSDKAWKKRKVSCAINKEDAAKILCELQDFKKMYPER